VIRYRFLLKQAVKFDRNIGSRKKARKNDDGEEEKEYTYDQPDHPLYKNLEPAMLEVCPSLCTHFELSIEFTAFLQRIHNEILDRQLTVHWEDIAGLQDVKTTLNEMIILPHRRPDV